MTGPWIVFFSAVYWILGVLFGISLAALWGC